MVKSLLALQQHDVEQFHVYSLADVEKEADANFEFEVMGLVKNLTGTTPHAFELTEAGIAYGTCATVLGGYRFNDSLSQRLHLTAADSIRGCAFTRDSSIIYALWAQTSIDNSEFAYQIFDFPDSTEIGQFERIPWHHLTSNMTDTISSSGIVLTGAPIFLKAIFNENDDVIEEPNDPVMQDTTDNTISSVNNTILEKTNIKVFPNPTSGEFTATFYLKNTDDLNAALYDVTGKPVKQVFTNKRFLSGEVLFKIGKTALPDGVYYLKVSGETFTGISRIGIY